jgi:hypothetical protein
MGRERSSIIKFNSRSRVRRRKYTKIIMDPIIYTSFLDKFPNHASVENICEIYKNVVSHFQSLKNRNGKFFENTISNVLKMICQGIDARLQIYEQRHLFSNGTFHRKRGTTETLTDKPDFIIAIEGMENNIRHAILVSAKTSARERFKQDARVIALGPFQYNFVTLDAKTPKICDKNCNVFRVKEESEYLIFAMALQSQINRLFRSLNITPQKAFLPRTFLSRLRSKQPLS